MGKLIDMNGDNREEHSSLDDAVSSYVPFYITVLGQRHMVMGTLGSVKKQQEFFDTYWPKFVKGLENLNPYEEFNPDFVIGRYNSLPEITQAAVQLQCAEEYSLEGKLLYSVFTDLVNSYVSKEYLDNEPPCLR